MNNKLLKALIIITAVFFSFGIIVILGNWLFPNGFFDITGGIISGFFKFIFSTLWSVRFFSAPIIIIIIIVLILLYIKRGDAMNENNNSSNNNNSDKYSGEINDITQEFSVQNQLNLDVDIDIGTLEICKVNSTTNEKFVRFETHNSTAGTMKFMYNNDSLTIKQKIPNKLSTLSLNKNINHKSKFVIFVSDNTMCNEIKINQNVGKFVVNDISCNCGKINNNVASFTSNNCNFNEVNFNANIGDSTYSNCNFTNCKIDSSVGKISICGDFFKENKITSSIGNIDINLKDSLSAYNIITKSNIGKVSINGEKNFTCNSTNPKAELNIYSRIGALTVKTIN